MDIRGSMQPSRPQSIAELVKQAEAFDFNINIPLKHWTRAAETLFQEANFALADGNYAFAYVMLYRHSILVLNYLPTHPQSKDPEIKKACRALSRRIDRQVLESLETLKPEIESARQEWDLMHKPAKEPARPPKEPKTYQDFAARDPTLSGNAKILDASEHQDLAVDLAQKELTRRDTARRASRQAGIPEEVTSSRRRGGRWEEWDAAHRGPDVDLQRQMEATRRTLDTPSAARDGDSTSSARPSEFVSSNYSYPSISKSRPVDYERADSYTSQSSTTQPSRPPKEPAQDSASKPPEIPRKVALDDYKPLIPSLPPRPGEEEAPTLPPRPQLEQPPLPPKFDLAPPKPKKERTTFKPGAYLENGDPLRSIFLPRGLKDQFLKLASENTRKGIEMCGILCGTPINNALFIRCLLIPDQKCTPDTCETENESSVFDYCDQEDLLMVGWIHTHPTQTCFMSSRDLHTHAGYQIMMPESIAVVCAPKFEPSYGIFRLTRPPGLEHILACTHSDTFHQHSIGNLYRDASQPAGHVHETSKMEFYVHDLRTK